MEPTVLGRNSYNIVKLIFKLDLINELLISKLKGEQFERKMLYSLSRVSQKRKEIKKQFERKRTDNWTDHVSVFADEACEVLK